MLTHEQIWTAIDRLATQAGLSPSGLARRSGLDPTTFNKSKRITSDGRARWPSTESVAKALAATGVGIESFVHLIEASEPSLQTVPLLSLSLACTEGHFDDNGHPAGRGWGEATLPAMNGEHTFALEIAGDQMAPAYRDGDIIIVSPTAPVRRGDRVVVRTHDGELMVHELRRRTAKSIEMQSLDATHSERTLDTDNIAWIARIVWASQ